MTFDRSSIESDLGWTILGGLRNIVFLRPWDTLLFLMISNSMNLRLNNGSLGGSVLYLMTGCRWCVVLLLNVCNALAGFGSIGNVVLGVVICEIACYAASSMPC